MKIMKKSKKRTRTPSARLEELQLKNQQMLYDLILDYVHLRSLIMLKRNPQENVSKPGDS